MFITSLLCTAQANSQQAYSQFLQSPDVKQIYPQQVEVFGIPIIATKNSDGSAIEHAIKVMTGYLDNDHDGNPDRQIIIDTLRDQNATLIIAKYEDQWEDAFDLLLEQGEMAQLDIDGQSLYVDEINPAGRFDASLEEILHLITQKGYAYAYPNIWGEKVNSQVAKLMDQARGGHFQRVPRNYSKTAWYHYNDTSCDYSCQITEYVYWSLTSFNGTQEHRQNEIGDEWELHTLELVNQRDPHMWQLMTDATFGLPLKHPLR